ncbi:hypothetical protein PG987_014641 [Apiospora arundinis]
MISVCSPTPYDLTSHDSFEWPSDLPWIRFTNWVSEAPVDILGLMVRRLLREIPESGPNELVVFGGSFTLPEVSRRLGLSLPLNSLNPVKLTGYFRCMMPESIPGEHLLRSQQLTKDFHSLARELIICILYHISNGDDIYHNGCSVRQDELILDLITQSGLVGSMNPSLLTEPTFNSILDEVWRAALRRCRAKIVTWILDVRGRLNLPDEPFPFRFWLTPGKQLHTPLIVAVSNVHPNLRCCSQANEDRHPLEVSNHDVDKTVRVLLAHGASPDCFCCDGHGTPLETAVRKGLPDTVKIFVEHGINIHGQKYLQKLDFDNLLQLHGPPFTLENQDAMLDYLQSIYTTAFPNLRGLFDALLCPEGLINAAVKGCPALLDRLRAKGADFNCSNAKGEFPLGAVIAHEPRLIHMHWRRQCYELLLTLGASVNYVPSRTSDQDACPSALHIASSLGHDDIVRLLLENEAHHHAPARLCIGGTWLYGLDTLANNIDADHANHARSPLSWALSQAGRTALRYFWNQELP